MYCAQCGATIDNDSLFCSACGARIANAENNPSRIIADQSHSAGTAADTEQCAEDPASLQNAVESTRKRSRRRMPLIMLVALAIALTATIAFAAHYAYTEYIAPQQATNSESEQDSNITKDISNSNREIAYKLFYDKCQEYLTAYGNPNIASTGAGMDYASGLSFANLIDFDKNGTNELICSYCTESTVNIPGATVEVWAYDDNTKTINLVYSGEARQDTNGGFAGIDLVDTGEKVLIKTMEFIPPTPPQYHYQEMKSSGFAESTSIEQSLKSSARSNGETGSESQYYENGNPIEVAEQIYFLSPSSDSRILSSVASSWNKNAGWYTPAQVIDLTNETLATLKEAN